MLHYFTLLRESQRPTKENELQDLIIILLWIITKEWICFTQWKIRAFINHKVKPVRRTYIPKKNGKKRPLGIPTIKDRIYQMICKLALEPVWESKFEPTSYGFRPCRGTIDAISRIHLSARKLGRPWIFRRWFSLMLWHIKSWAYNK